MRAKITYSISYPNTDFFLHNSRYLGYFCYISYQSLFSVYFNLTSQLDFEKKLAKSIFAQKISSKWKILNDLYETCALAWITATM